MNAISKLKEYLGKYEGEGINHDQQNFKGYFELRDLLDGRGIELIFLAEGMDGEIYHQEKSLICTDFSSNIKMWNLNNNSPGMAELELISSDESLIFAMGDKNDTSIFREEIKIELNTSEIGYHYSWGLPGGEFAYRSGLLMKKTN